MISHYVIEGIMALVNVAMADWHARLIRENRPVIHWLWAAGYLLLLIPIWYIFNSWLLLFSCVLVREIVFSPALNFFRDKSFFYTNPSRYGSILDKIEKGAWLEIVYFGSVVIFIILQFFL